MHGQIRRLCHYPVKGLAAQTLTRVELTQGQGFPMDRMFGFARPGSGFDPAHPRPLPKTKFVVLARDAALATLPTFYDTETGILTLGTEESSEGFDITDAPGRQAAAARVAGHLGLDDADAPTLHSAHPHRFTDVSVVSPAMMNAVSLINLDSVAAFERDVGQPIDPARFRGNLLFSGLPPFAELEMVGQQITIGAATLRIVRRTKRCPATEVNLETGRRDLDVPRLLRDHYGHSDMGVYAEVIAGGPVAIGDAVSV